MMKVLTAIKNCFCYLFGETNIERHYRERVVQYSHYSYPVYGSPFAPYSRNHDADNMALIVREIRRERECQKPI